MKRLLSVRTISGGVYEVNEGGQVRRLGGPFSTARATQVWRDTKDLQDPEVGKQWLITWGTINPDGSEQATLTSLVLEIVYA